MMKIHHFVGAAVLSIASLASSSAMAQVYLAGSVGSGRVDFDCSGASSCDKTDTAFRGTLGYGFASGLAAELGYAGYGKARASGLDLHGEIKSTALQLGAAYQLALGSDWGLNFRLGVARVKAKAWNSLDGSSSDSSTKPYYGIGVNYGLTKSLRAELAVEGSKSEYYGDKADLRTWTVGLRYQF